jgi:non-canonical (house-cleaning) NTP pyrophosphatase
VEVPSGVRHTPLTRADIMSGARNRTEALLATSRAKKEMPQYFVGLEGGLDIIQDRGDRHVFLENWAYVLDAAGRGSFGQSGGILLPEDLAHTVVDEGVELGEAIDLFAGARGIRDAQGAWGVLSSNLITRQDAFVTALINAFAPFYNASLYLKS